jgi:peptidoglycan hydrolase CwlO-like protein
MENFKIEQTDDLKGIVELEFPKAKFKDYVFGKSFMIVYSIIVVVSGAAGGYAIHKSVNATYISICFVLLLLLVALLAFFKYKVAAQKLSFEIAEAQAISALKRKLVEDAITREIKYLENKAKNTDSADNKDATKRLEQLTAEIREMEKQVKFYKQFFTEIYPEEKKKEIKMVIEKIESAIPDLKKND